MPSGRERHVLMCELPPGLRRRCVQIAIAMSFFSFGAFILVIAGLLSHVTHPSDSQTLLILGLIATVLGIGHGIHARLKLQDTESGEFISKPGPFDFTLLVLSAVLLTAGCWIAVVTT